MKYNSFRLPFLFIVCYQLRLTTVRSGKGQQKPMASPSQRPLQMQFPPSPERCWWRALPLWFLVEIWHLETSGQIITHQSHISGTWMIQKTQVQILGNICLATKTISCNWSSFISLWINSTCPYIPGYLCFNQCWISDYPLGRLLSLDAFKTVKNLGNNAWEWLKLPIASRICASWESDSNEHYTVLKWHIFLNMDDARQDNDNKNGSFVRRKKQDNLVTPPSEVSFPLLQLQRQQQPSSGQD